MRSMVDPFEMIKKAPAGIMTFGRAKEKVGDPFNVIFLIREDDKYIRNIGNYPQIEVRSGFMATDKVATVLIMARFALNWDLLYDCWFNFHAPDGEFIFEDMARQENMIFKFYNTREEKRSLAIPNRFKETFAGHIKKIKAEFEPWSMADFDHLKNSIYIDYPDGRSLWNALGQ